MHTATVTRRAIAVLLLVAAITPSARAQQSSRPPLRPLGPALATSEPLGAVAAVQALPGGRLLVNDPVKRQVVLLDSLLKRLAVVADTTPATKNAYGARNGGLLPFRGDSALFVDPNSLSMLVIDPAGKIARVMAAPRANDVFFLLGGPMGTRASTRRDDWSIAAWASAHAPLRACPASRSPRPHFRTVCRSSATISTRASSTRRRS